MIDFDGEDLHVAALTMIGEARGEPQNGKIGVAWVLRNRAQAVQWPDTIKAVAKQPLQFSTWNESADNLTNLHRMATAGWSSDLYRECRAIAAGVFADLLSDPTSGATHYHAESISPSWSADMHTTARIGNHVFLRG